MLLEWLTSYIPSPAKYMFYHIQKGFVIHVLIDDNSSISFKYFSVTNGGTANSQVDTHCSLDYLMVSVAKNEAVF